MFRGGEGSATDLVIEDNVIAGNSWRGVVLTDTPEPVTLTGNFIGVLSGGRD